MGKVTKVISVMDRVSKAGKPYKISKVTVDDGNLTQDAEMFGTATEGQEGTMEFDATYNKWSFKPDIKSGGSFSGGGTKVFKADPDKMDQDKKLAIATNQSIQRQVAMKGAVELIVAGKREYGELTSTFKDLMDLISK